MSNIVKIASATFPWCAAEIYVSPPEDDLYAFSVRTGGAALQTYATRAELQALAALLNQITGGAQAPLCGDKENAMQCLNSIVSLMGGDKGSSIQLRAWIAAQPDKETT